jgi:hypothetical protein
VVRRKKSKPVIQSLKKQSRQRSSDARIVCFIFLGVIIIFFSWFRIHLLSFPLERDEGEYAYFGQLILQGIPPYSMAYNLKMPGIYYCYAFIMWLFGQTPTGIHLGLLFFNIGSILFLFFVIRKLSNDFVALLATSSFALLSVSPVLLGQAAHATQFVTFFMLAGLWFLVKGFDRNHGWWFLLSGILFSIAFLMKQSGIFFTLFGGVMILLWYFFHHNRIGFGKILLRLVLFSAGAAFPVALVFLIMKHLGVFENFWFWTMVYPGVYGSKVPFSEAWNMLRINFSPMVSIFTGLWILAALGIPSIIFYPAAKWNKSFILLFLFFSMLTVIPGFYFRQHYFIPLLPAVGWMIGIFLDTINQKISPWFKGIPWVTGAFFLVLVIIPIRQQKGWFFDMDPVTLCRFVYAGNPFTESIPVARYIETNTSLYDKILIFGSEPQLAFYSGRKSATGYIYMYDLVYDHPYVGKMQDEMFREAEESKPAMAIFVSVPYSWLARPEVSDTLFRWFNDYLVRNQFKTVGVVELKNPPESSIYAWDQDAAVYQRQSDQFMMIFKR